MKRILLSLLFAGVVWAAAGQTPSEVNSIGKNIPGRHQEHHYRLFPDTMRLRVPNLYLQQHPGYSPMTPVVSMSSIMKIRARYSPRTIDVIPYKVRSSWFSISNGQAQNWGPYPNSYLDARTLSFPAPRR